MKTIEYILPDWTLCPLFNGDETGITDEESQVLADFIAEHVLAAGYNGTPVDHEELGFSWRNDLDNLGGNCHLVTFQKLKELPK